MFEGLKRLSTTNVEKSYIIEFIYEANGIEIVKRVPVMNSTRHLIVNHTLDEIERTQHIHRSLVTIKDAPVGKYLWE